MKEKIVFFGSSKYVLPVIEMLQKNYALVLVITTEQNSFDPVPEYCQRNAVAYMQIKHLRETSLATTITKLNPNVGVVASFGCIIPNAYLNLFPLGLLNIHPSLLPAYRGSSPVQATLLDGRRKTGISIIRLDEKMDHGPLVTQRESTIDSHDTSETLYYRLFKEGALLLETILPLYIEQKIVLKEQDHPHATYTKILQKSDGFIDVISPPPPPILTRMIKAYYPWPGVWLEWKLDGKNKKRIKLLPNNIIQIEGKNKITFDSFINGYKNGRGLLMQLGLLEQQE